MLKNIKSQKICKMPLSLLVVNKKLKIIKYNKEIQKKLNISLIDFKEYSGRHIVYESKTKGSEYDKDEKLIFVGEYLNGEKNGFGKEYNKNGKLIFEGEYLKDKKCGKGIKYNDDGYKKFEGEFLNNQIIKGEEFNREGELIFKGEFKNEKKWQGVGKEVIDYKSSLYDDFTREYIIYEGEFKRGEINGKGKEYLEYYYRECPPDNFKLINNVLLFEGKYKNGKRWKGKEYDDAMENIIVFEGLYKDGQRWDGQIKYSSISDIHDTRFVGEIKNGKRLKGKEFDFDFNLVFEGVYKSGKRFKGKEFIHGELIFEGEYISRKRLKRKGLEFDDDDEIIGKKYDYQKRWNGKGKEYSNGDLVFEGVYKNGEKISEILDEE